jgi:hypothetical protein
MDGVAWRRRQTGTLCPTSGTAVLDYDSDSEIVDRDSLYEYSGRKNFKQARSIEAVVDTRDCTLSILGDFFPNLERFA